MENQSEYSIIASGLYDSLDDDQKDMLKTSAIFKMCFERLILCIMSNDSFPLIDLFSQLCKTNEELMEKVIQNEIKSKSQSITIHD